MGNIAIRVDRDRRLTIHEVAGKISAEEIVSALDEFYSNSPTLFVLWDFSRADVSGLANEDVKRIMLYAKAKARVRKGGKSALVGTGDLGFGLGRMYVILAEVYEHSAVHKVFKTMDEALEWLFEEERGVSKIRSGSYGRHGGAGEDSSP